MSPDHVLDILIAIGAGITGGIVWFVRLEGRVDLISRVVEDFIQDRKTAMSQVLTHMDRIEGKIDRISHRCAAFQHLYDTTTREHRLNAPPLVPDDDAE